ncbi:MAG TPA: alpha amylase C-terminal domain-containing protein, partial [Microlunatus sp.]|nr:alpha amylase C-terminal domain-containing protein [Microlunatus sp.]
FMGTEFGQRREFSEQRSIDWDLTQQWGHRGVQLLVKELNRIYRAHPALWRLDNDPAGFRWINADDSAGNVFSFLRFDGEGEIIASVINFSADPKTDYRIGLPTEGRWTEILNTDADLYDGSGTVGNLGQVIATDLGWNGQPASATISVPPLGAVWFRYDPHVLDEQPEPEKADAAAQEAARLASPGS